MMASDIGRGIDVVSFTAEPNWMPTAAAGGPADNANANAHTRVGGVQQERSIGTLAATGEDTPLELGAVLLLSAVALRLGTTRRRSAS